MAVFLKLAFFISAVNFIQLILQRCYLNNFLILNAAIPVSVPAVYFCSLLSFARPLSTYFSMIVYNMPLAFNVTRHHLLAIKLALCACIKLLYQILALFFSMHHAFVFVLVFYFLPLYMLDRLSVLIYLFR